MLILCIILGIIMRFLHAKYYIIRREQLDRGHDDYLLLVGGGSGVSGGAGGHSCSGYVIWLAIAAETQGTAGWLGRVEHNGLVQNLVSTQMQMSV